MTPRLTRVILTGLVVVLLSVASVAAWTIDDSPDPNAPVLASGAALFRSKGCVGCHNGPDASSVVNIGPDLRSLKTLAFERRPGMTTADYIRESIVAPQAFTATGFGTTQMPTLQLSPEEVEALVGYLMDS